MFIIAHFIAGLIIGKLTNNYTAAIAGALLMDIDHLIPFFKHKVLFDIKKFWKTVTDPKDHLGDQRNYLHTVFVWGPVVLVSLALNNTVLLIFSLGWLSHIVLDMLDGSDFHPFYPIKYNLKGPIGYFSKNELIFTFGLGLAYFLI